MNAKNVITVALAMLLAIAPMAKAEDPVVFDDANLKAAVEAALDISNPTPSDMLGLTRLEAPDKVIVKLTGIQYSANLRNLDLVGNQISDISPLSGLTNLRDLKLGDNHISDISPLSGLTNLTRLILNYNQISVISPLSRLTNLTWLKAHHNQISDVSPLSGMTNLVKLKLNNNQISDISPLSRLTNLTVLFLYDNQISDISPVSGLEKLTWLRLGANRISDISALSGLTNLTTLRLSRNPVSDISALSGLTHLSHLHLRVNQISDISALSGLTNLSEVNLHLNQISDISPLSGLTNLTLLNLKSNSLNKDAYCIYIPKIRENNPGIDLRYDTNPYVCILWVEIDIKPGSYPNSVNLGSQGVIPVGILSDPDFDATTVDADTVALAGSGVAVRGKGSKLMAHEEDVNGDGLVDLVVQVETENLDPGSFQDGYAVLTATTFDSQDIEGQDEIIIVPPE